MKYEDFFSIYITAGHERRWSFCIKFHAGRNFLMNERLEKDQNLDDLVLKKNSSQI